VRSSGGQGEIPGDPWLADRTAIAPENEPGSISDEQLTDVQAAAAKLFSKDEREQRLAAAEQIIGRKLTGPKKRGRSFSNLAHTEATKLADTFDATTRADLVADMALRAAAK
jgi:hypothetical protein